MAADRRRTRPAGSIRLIGGQWRSRKLPVPDLPGLRPTPDRVRETLFNWLAPVIQGSRCLDLFAGTGALGLEAASRGAAEVWLVEQDLRAVAQLRENLERLQAGQVRVVAGAVAPLLAQAPARPFDIAFVDPPYAAGLLPAVLADLAAGAWLRPGALVYIEWPQEAAPPLPGPPWRSLRAGAVCCALYHWPGDGLASAGPPGPTVPGEDDSA